MWVSKGCTQPLRFYLFVVERDAASPQGGARMSEWSLFQRDMPAEIDGGLGEWALLCRRGWTEGVGGVIWSEVFLPRDYRVGLRAATDLRVAGTHAVLPDASGSEWPALPPITR